VASAFLIAVAEKGYAEETALVLASAGINSQLSFRKENPTSRWVIEVEAARLLEAQQLISEEDAPRPKALPEQLLGEKSSLAWIAGLISINMVVWWLLEQHGSSHDSATLLRFGAIRTLLLVDGEWWRTVNALFLHIGLKHLAGNMATLAVLGVLTLRAVGPGRLLFIYVVAGVMGNWASYFWNPSFAVKAGASGAILGLLGALSGVRLRQLFLFPASSRYKLWHVPAMLIAFYGFVIGIEPSVDHTAHIGGLLSGLLLGALVPTLPEANERTVQWLAGLSAVFLCLIAWLETSPMYP